MVIKKIPSTKATKKQNSIRLWKKLYKNIRDLLKETNNSNDLLQSWKLREELTLKKARKKFKQTRTIGSFKQTHNTRIIKALSMDTVSVNNESTELNETHHESISMIETISPNQELSSTLKSSSEVIQAIELNSDTIRRPLASIALDPEMLLPSDMTNKNSNQIELEQRRYFNPIQSNKIYPESSSSYTSVTSGFSKNSDFFETRRPISTIMTRKNSDNYIKNDLYPKFPSNPNNCNLK